MKFSQLKQHLQNAEHYAAYVPFGNDRYLVTYAKKLLCGLTDLPDLNVNTFNGAADPYQVLKACSIMPFMSKTRVVVYEGFKVLDPVILNYLKNPCADTVLILMPKTETVPDALKKFDCVATVDCAHLDSTMLTSWIKKQSAGKIDEDACSLLIDYTMSDLARIETELRKLTEYVGERNIAADDVRRMVNRDVRYEIYELTQAVTDGRTDEAYGMTERILREADPLTVIKALSTAYHKLLHVRISRVSDEELCALLGMKSSALWYLRKRAQKFSPVSLRTTYNYILDCEHRVKTGKLTSRAAVDHILLKVFSAKAQ